MNDIVTSIHGRDIGLDAERNLVVRSGKIRAASGDPIRFPDGIDGPREGIINVWDFAASKPSGVMCDGSDDYPAFVAARDSVASTESVCVYVPRGAYTLGTSVTNNGRFVRFDIEAGATFSGVGILFGSSEFKNNPVVQEEYFRGVPGSNQVVGKLLSVSNTSASSAGYGCRMNYVNTGAPSSGFDLATGYICEWEGMAGGQAQVAWNVYHTPNSGTWTGGFAWTEINPVNRGPDMGWANRPGALARWVGGSRFVPESADFTGDGGTGRHVHFAYTVSPSGSNNADGVKVRTYNGYLIEPNAIAPDGYATYFNGSTSVTSSEWPVAMLGGQDTWEYGAKLNGCTFGVDNLAILLGAAHSIGWADGSNVVTATIRTGTGTPEGAVTANVGSLFLRTDGGVGTTLYVKQTGTGNTGWAAK